MVEGVEVPFLSTSGTKSFRNASAAMEASTSVSGLFSASVVLGLPSGLIVTARDRIVFPASSTMARSASVFESIVT